MSEQKHTPKTTYQNTEADNIASAQADSAFAAGKWQEFIGHELTPVIQEGGLPPVPVVKRLAEPNRGSNYPEFYVPVEKQEKLSDEQLAESKAEFDSLFEDMMLRDMGLVKRFESIKGRPTASLLRKLRVENQDYTLALRDNQTEKEVENSLGIVFRDSEKIRRELSVQRVDGVFGREQFSYRLGADGIVRRWDGGDLAAKRKEERELGIERRGLQRGATIDEIGRAALEGLKSISEQIPNSRLAEDMGLNMRPVSPQELIGLRAFLESATYKDE